jgi:hypothetical protein
MRAHLQGEQMMFRNVWWMESGQQQLQIVNLQTTSTKHCTGAVMSSTAANSAAGMHAATERGARITRAQQPWVGSGSTGPESISAPSLPGISDNAAQLQQVWLPKEAWNSAASNLPRCQYFSLCQQSNHRPRIALRMRRCTYVCRSEIFDKSSSDKSSWCRGMLWMDHLSSQKLNIGRCKWGASY